MTNDSRNTSINKKSVSLILQKNAGNRCLWKDFDENSPFHRSLSLYIIFILSTLKLHFSSIYTFIIYANQELNLIHNGAVTNNWYHAVCWYHFIFLCRMLSMTNTFKVWTNCDNTLMRLSYLMIFIPIFCVSLLHISSVLKRYVLWFGDHFIIRNSKNLVNF